MYTLKWATITFVALMAAFTTALFAVILGRHFVAWEPLSGIYWPAVWGVLRMFTLISLGLTFCVVLSGMCSKDQGEF